MSSSMRITISDVMRQLRAEGLAVAADESSLRDALHAADESDVPWYVRVFAGTGAWLATVLLIWFLAATGVVENPQGALALGVVLVTGAVVLRRRTAVEFLRHFSVAVSFTGQALLLFGIHGVSDSAFVTGLTAAGLSVVLLRLVPDALHRFLSAVGGSIAAVIAVGELSLRYGFEGVVLLIVALAAFAWRGGTHAGPERDEIAVPVGSGLVIALFGLLLFGTAFSDKVRLLESALWRLGGVTTIGITLALVLLMLAILDEQGTPRQSPKALVYLASVVVLGALTLSSPGIVAGAAVLALGFDRRNPILIGVAACFLLVFGSVYYYSLHLTLLEKSGVLAASGMLLLLVRQVAARTPLARGAA